MSPRGAPRPLGGALGRARAAAAPQTALAAAQLAWPEVAGAAIAAESEPVSDRAGVLTVACRSAVWAQELDLLAPELLRRLNERLGSPLRGLRFTADAARHDPPPPGGA